jgi:uncharacterized membrane protein YfcA
VGAGGEGHRPAGALTAPVDSAAGIAIVAGAFLLAGTVKGVIGMGLPTVAIGVLGLVMPPVQAAALLIVPSLATNVWQMLAGPAFAAAVKRFATMLIGVCAGIFLGIGLLAGATAIASAALGGVLAVYGALGLISVHLAVPRRAERWLSPLVGLVTGVLTGATGVFVVPAVPYLGSLGLERETLIQTLGLSFTVSTIALAAALAATGQFPASAATTSAFALAPAFAGMFLGQWIRVRIRPEVFRRWFFVWLVVIGTYMFVRALASMRA